MKQTVTVLVGNVGSGKTTFYENEFDPELDVRISQDVLGSKEACIEAVKKALKEGKSVVIDRVNFNQKQRQTWVDLAVNYNAEPHAIYLEVPIDVSLERIKNRKGHETIKEDMTEEKKREIVEQFDKMMKAPSLSEGFKSVIMLRNYE